MIIDKLKGLLGEALNSSGESRAKAISEFQNFVWDDTSIHDEEVNDIVTDAAYIFDFYEPNAEWRKESPNYYDDLRLEEEIRAVLQKFKDKGM